MMAGGAAFLIGTALVTFAMHMAMLVLGRLVLGIGVGFATQVWGEGTNSRGSSRSSSTRGGLVFSMEEGRGDCGTTWFAPEDTTAQLVASLKVM